MSTSKLWTDFSLLLHAATAQSAAAVNLQGIVSQEYNGNLQTGVERADGQVYPSFGSLRAGAPRAMFSTLDIAGALDEISLSSGMLIDKDGTHPGVVMGFQRIASGGTRDATTATTHYEITIENGLIIPRSLNLSHQQTAALDCEIVPFATSSVDPVTFAEAAALATVSPAIPAEFTLGPVDLNGTQLEGVSSVSIDFGFELIVDSKDSDIFPSFVAIRSIAPRLTIRTVHPDITSTLTEKGLEFAESTVVVYAKKRDEGGDYVADVTAEHVAFTFGACRLDPQSIGGDPKELTIQAAAWQDTAAPITVDTTSAISI